MTMVQINAKLCELCAEVVYQSRAYIRSGYRPVAQCFLQKIDFVTEASASPAIAKFAGRSLQREDSITSAMETSASETILLD